MWILSLHQQTQERAVPREFGMEAKLTLESLVCVAKESNQMDVLYHILEWSQALCQVVSEHFL